MDKRVVKPNPRRGTAGGIALLIGGFLLLFCALDLPLAGWRAYREHMIETRWIGTQATIERRALFVRTHFVGDSTNS